MTEPVYANTSSEEGAAAALSLYNSNPDMDALIVAGGGGDPLVGSIGALAVKGNYTKDEGSFGYEIEFPYLYVSSPDDYENYQKYFVDDDPYTDEEIVEMAGYSFDDLNKAATSLSIDDVISRHSN